MDAKNTNRNGIVKNSDTWMTLMNFLLIVDFMWNVEFITKKPLKWQLKAFAADICHNEWEFQIKLPQCHWKLKKKYSASLFRFNEISKLIIVINSNRKAD